MKVLEEVEELRASPAGELIVILPDEVELEPRAKKDQDAARRRKELLLLRQIEGQIDAELEHDLTLEGGDGQFFEIPRLCRWIGRVSAALLAVLLIVGWPYYSLPALGRPLHPLHGLLRPSGTIGLPLGILGTLLLVASLAYIVRKRLVSWTRLGSLQTWMGFHIFSGLLGASFILFHAAFIPASAIGTFAFSSMGIVLFSGFIGRYVYAYVPRSLEGRELEFELIRRRLTVYKRKLVALDVRPDLLDTEVGDLSKKRSAWRPKALWRLITGDREAAEELERLCGAVRSEAEGNEHLERTLVLVRRLFKERQWLVRYQEIRDLIGTWRFLHRWFAVVLFVAVLYHVAIAVRFGDLWVLGR